MSYLRHAKSVVNVIHSNLMDCCEFESITTACCSLLSQEFIYKVRFFLFLMLCFIIVTTLLRFNESFDLVCFSKSSLNYF